MRKLFFFALFFILFLNIVSAAEGGTAIIYYNEACSMCTTFLNSEMLPLLDELGIKEITLKDYVNEKNNRVELNKLNEQFGVPFVLQGHFTILVNNRILLQGHVPEHIVRAVLKESNQKKFDRIIVFQDEMENPTSYKVWAFTGKIKEYPIQTSLNQYLDWFAENKQTLVTPPELLERNLDPGFLLPLIIITGLLDGINPCAFGVLMFFIAFLYSMKRSKFEIWKVGATFIFMIFLTYLFIGLGLLQAMLITGVPHLFGKISAVFMLLLAAVNIKDYFFYGRWFSLRMPSFAAPLIKKRMEQITLASVIVLGFLVGLCTFPCSGGIYVGVLSLLAMQTTFVQGLFYLLIYNLMFVVPLIVILALASSRRVVRKMDSWEKENKKTMKLVSGIVLLVLAAILWFFSF